jgi:hypothetical protein
MTLDLVSALLRYLAAYEAKDLGTLEAMLAPEVRLQDWNILVTGKDAVLAETKKNFAGAASLSIKVVQIFSNPPSAAAHLRIAVNETVHLEVVDVVTFNAVGQVIAIRAFKG